MVSRMGYFFLVKKLKISRQYIDKMVIAVTIIIPCIKSISFILYAKLINNSKVVTGVLLSCGICAMKG